MLSSTLSQEPTMSTNTTRNPEAEAFRVARKLATKYGTCRVYRRGATIGHVSADGRPGQEVPKPPAPITALVQELRKSYPYRFGGEHYGSLEAARKAVESFIENALVNGPGEVVARERDGAAWDIEIKVTLGRK
jgi:hypothetical protein